MTLAEMWKTYASARKDELRSWATVEGHARHLLRILGPDRDVATLSLDDVDAYRAQRRQEETPRGELCRPATRNHELSTLRAALNFTVARKRLAVNPLGGMKREREDNTRQTALTEDDLAKLLPKCTWWLKPLVLLAFDSGMRREELRLLRHDQLEGDGAAILISPKNTKTGRGRRIPLTSRTSAVLRAFPRFGDYVFANPASTRPWGKGTLDEAFRKAVKRAGLKGATGETVRFHDLRRSFATNARRRGVSETVVMKLTGHRTRSVFDRYNIVAPAELDEAVALLEVGSNRERGDKPTPPAAPPAPADLKALVAEAVHAALSARSKQPRRAPVSGARRKEAA
jgi:integrase